jgi:hypothetical protein
MIAAKADMLKVSTALAVPIAAGDNRETFPQHHWIVSKNCPRTALRPPRIRADESAG